MGKSLTRTEIRMEKTKENIIDAALEIFDECGYMKAKISKITEKANVGYGTFYQYFKNKKELLNFLSEEMSNNIGGYTHLETQKLLDIKKRFYHGVIYILDFYLKYRTVFLIVSEAAVSDKTFVDSERKIHKNLFESIALDINYFINNGLCRKSVDNMTIFAIGCMIEGYAKQMLKMPEEEVDTDKIAKTLAKASYNALFDGK